MGKENFSGTPDDTHHFFNSYGAITPEMQQRTEIKLIEREHKLIADSAEILVNPPPGLLTLLDYPPALPFNHGILLSTFECASLILRYPQLLYKIPNFPPVFRTLRSQEIFSQFQRGGNTLFCGSYYTVYEVLAMYSSPPSKADILAMANLNSRGEVQLSPNNLQIPLLEGHAVAIEPVASDLAVREKIAAVAQGVGLETTKFDLHGLTIGQAIDDKVIPNNLDTVIFNRADPRIFYGEDFPHYDRITVFNHKAQQQLKRRAWRQIEQVIIPLVEKIKPGGYFVLTVGQGNDLWESLSRQNLGADLTASLDRLGLRVRFSQPFNNTTDPTHEYAFGSPEYGIVGCVVGQKMS